MMFFYRDKASWMRFNYVYQLFLIYRFNKRNTIKIIIQVFIVNLAQCRI